MHGFNSDSYAYLFKNVNQKVDEKLGIVLVIK